MSKLDEKLKKLADKYGIYTKEEFFQAYNEMERMNIGVFVTVFGKEKDERKEDSHGGADSGVHSDGGRNHSDGRTAGNVPTTAAYIHA